MSHGLAKAIERDIFLFANSNKEKPLCRHMTLGMIDQKFVRFALELFCVNEVLQRSAQDFIEGGRVIPSQPLSFTMSQDENLCGIRLRPSCFGFDLHDVHSFPPIT